MSGSADRREGELYDWDAYRHWPDDSRWELIAGRAYAMTPAPNTRHQRLVGRLFREISSFLDGKRCEVFVAPVDVKLSERDIVQPDLVVVCDPAQVTATHIEGAPTMVVEIVSASSARHDRVRKLALYARSGLKEVWLVTPYPALVEVFHLDGGTYRLAAAFSEEDILTTPSLPGLRIALAGVFDFPVDPGERVDVVKEGARRTSREAMGPAVHREDNAAEGNCACIATRRSWS